MSKFLEIVSREKWLARDLTKTVGLSRKERFNWTREYNRLFDLECRLAIRAAKRKERSK